MKRCRRDPQASRAHMAAGSRQAGVVVSAAGPSFYLTVPEPCPYLPDRKERRVLALLDELPPGMFDLLTELGFRRSQRYVYRPDCPGCRACISVRIPVAQFRWSRTFRRVWRRNADLTPQERPPLATREQYALFRRYLDARHAGGGMHGMDYADYRALVEEAAAGTLLVEFRDRLGQLVAVSVTDRIRSGLSGVYKFFDPALAGRSLGTLVVLWHVVRAGELGLPYVYLGYWIAACRKMAYKARFRPLERLTAEGHWRPFEPVADDGPSPTP